MPLYPSARSKTITPSLFAVVLVAVFLYLPLRAFAGQSAAAAIPKTPAPDRAKRIELVFEPDAYYTDLDLIVSLTDAPIPHLGERSESDIYRFLLSHALAPRFAVLEASINPLPYLGTYIKERQRNFYNRARISGSFNWVKAFTAGFEEPYAASIFVGNVVDFDIPNDKDIQGKGYSGFLFSAGNYHIRDNELVKDEWQEYEIKMKGDRKSPVKKLSWSFRVGAKLHGNRNITDIIYLSFRRSRVDYQLRKGSLINNSGFEYTYDMDRRTFSPIRHYFFVDKKWPFENSRLVFSLAVGFVWESAKKYTGALAAGRERSDFQLLLRPNVEF